MAQGMRAGAAGGNRRRQGIGAVIVLLLLLPLVARPFTREINWTASDFAAAGVLLVGSALVYELAVRRIRGRGTRTIAALALLGALLLAWAHGAVGVF